MGEASSEVPEVKVEPPTEETTDEMNTSLGNLTADAGVTQPPSFPSVGIKITITSQASAPGSPSKPGEEDLADTSISENQIKSETDSSTVEEKIESEFDPDAIIQEKSQEDIEDPFRHKPKLSKLQKQLTIYPKKCDAEKQEASLCSIM